MKPVKKELGLENIIKLASNENPLGPSPKALEAVKHSLSDNFRYPDASARLFRIKLADKFDIKSENVIVGAGSEGVMSAIMRTFFFGLLLVISRAYVKSYRLALGIFVWSILYYIINSFFWHGMLKIRMCAYAGISHTGKIN